MHVGYKGLASLFHYFSLPQDSNLIYLRQLLIKGSDGMIVIIEYMSDGAAQAI